MNVNSNRTLFADKYIDLSDVDLYKAGAWLFNGDMQSAGYNKAVITVTSISGFGETQGLEIWGAAAKSNFFKLQLFKVKNDSTVKVDKIDSKGTYIVWLNNVGYWNISNKDKSEGSKVSMNCVVKYDSEPSCSFDIQNSLNSITASLQDNRDIYSGTVDLGTTANFLRIDNIEKKYQSAVLYLKYNGSTSTRSNISILCASRSVPIMCYDTKGNIYDGINYLAFDSDAANIFYFNISGLDSLYLRNDKAVGGATLEYSLVLCSESSDHLSRIKPNQKLCEFSISATGAEKSFGGYGDLDSLSSFFKYFKVYVRVTDSYGNPYNSNFGLSSYDYYKAEGTVKTYINGVIKSVSGTNVLSTELMEAGAYGNRFYVVFDETPPAGTLINAVIYGVR